MLIDTCSVYLVIYLYLLLVGYNELSPDTLSLSLVTAGRIVEALSLSCVTAGPHLVSLSLSVGVLSLKLSHFLLVSGNVPAIPFFLTEAVGGISVGNA